MKFSRKMFLKNAPACVKRQLKGHVDILDGMEVTFEFDDKWGLIPQYFVEGQEYYLYRWIRAGVFSRLREKRKNEV